MQTQTRIETITGNETANTFFHLLTIAMVGVFSLVQTLGFLAGAV